MVDFWILGGICLLSTEACDAWTTCTDLVHYICTMCWCNVLCSTNCRCQWITVASVTAWHSYALSSWQASLHKFTNSAKSLEWNGMYRTRSLGLGSGRETLPEILFGEIHLKIQYLLFDGNIYLEKAPIIGGDRGEYFSEKSIFLHGPQKWPCTRIQGPPGPRSVIFLHELQTMQYFCTEPLKKHFLWTIE